MHAIVTTALSATQTKPMRIKATCGRGSITLSWGDPAFDGLNHIEDFHRKAASMLCIKFLLEDNQRHGTTEGNPWGWPFVTGGLPSRYGCTYAHVGVDPRSLEL